MSISILIGLVDDFQGDENKIILLSLVRSNANNTIGFLKSQNRIIVALSRAQHGFYIVGNSSMLEKHNDWYNVLKYLRTMSCFGTEISLSCQNHTKTKTLVKLDDNFSRVSHGGCSIKCEEQLAVTVCYISYLI
jgi:hypothetical protein